MQKITQDNGSNEELQAMNEELRSAAQELETSKEELQSINEELVTVNQELKIKIEELSQSNNDFQNLINSTDIGTIFLDRYFRVKLFTPAAREIFNLIPADMGRPLSDITGRLEYDHLLQDAEEVLKKLQTIEREVNVKDSHAYLMHISPYRTAEDRINGVVIAFININALKVAEKALRTSEARLAGELAKMRNLYDSSTRILAMHNIEAALNETLFSCKQLLNADAANIQLYDGKRNTLSIVAQTGYPDEFIRLYKELSIDDDIACGRSVRLKKRIVIEDAYEDEGSQPYLYLVNAGGFRAVQSTPLFDYEGNLMGVLSTHFKERHIPMEEDLWTLDLYSRQIAAFISRTKAEEALRKSEERLRITVEAAVDYAIISTNIDGMIEGWNSGAEHIFKYSPEEVKGKSAHLIFTDEDKANNIPEKEMGAAREKGVASDERWHQRKDGSKFFMSGVMRPIYNPQLVGYVKVARDMTKQKLLEQQKDDFIGIASHELKTPVTSVKAYTEILRQMYDEESNEELSNILVKLDGQVDRMVELIRSLLDTTNLSHGQMQLSAERFDINELIKERIEELKITTRNHHLKFISGNEIFITADKRRIGEVLTNLLSNAIKYSTGGDDIIVTLSKTKNDMQVSIKDNGIGIPEDVKDKIFDRFYRVQNAQVNTFSGLGLGLYITASIIELHKGKIWVESQPGKGATFYFTLPLDQ